MRAFGRALISVPRVLDADLLREQHMTMSEYSALMHLSEASDRRLRMSELAALGAISLSGMTRIVSRLEAQGLVRRERSGTDGRGWLAALTDAGLQRLNQAWPTHLASVRRHLMAHLADVDLGSFTEALQRIADELQAAEAAGTSGRPR